MSELPHRTIEKFTIGFVLFLFIGTLPWTFLLFELDPNQEIPEQTRLTLRFFWLLAYIPTLVLFFNNWRDVFAQSRQNPLLLILVGLTVLSVVWSVSPMDTLRRGIGLLVTTLFGLFLAARCDRNDLLHYLAWALTGAMILSLIFGFMIPDWGKMSYGDELAWRGVFFHKNTMGETMLLYVIVLLYLFQENHRNRPYYILGIALGLLLLYLSKSMTPVLVGLVLIGAALFFKWLPRRRTFVVPWFALSFLWICFGAFLVFHNLEETLSFFGRDSSLTGRDKLWQALWMQIQSHFLLGFGYQAFWLDETGAVAVVWNYLGWKMSAAHNGYLELWLDLGIVGLMLYVVVFSTTLIKAVSLAIQESSWPFIFFSFFFLLNFSESRILEQNSLYWVLFVAISGQLHKKAALSQTNPRLAPDLLVSMSKTSEEDSAAR